MSKVVNKKNKVDKNKIINFYASDNVKPFVVDYVNPNFNFNTMPLKHPMRQIIVGASGSGKSNVLINIIHLMSDTFNEIKIFTQDKSEALYEMLESMIEKPFLEIYEGLTDLNKLDFKKLDGQCLFIFDDMVVESVQNQKMICELYIRGRKMANKKGISCIYLSQSYYRIPKIIRDQCTSIILKKIASRKETSVIIRDCSCLDVDSQTLQNMYSHCVANAADICNFFFIDKSANEKNFRKNFNEALDVTDFMVKNKNKNKNKDKVIELSDSDY